MSDSDSFEEVIRDASEKLEKDRLPRIDKESTPGTVASPRIWNLYAPEIWEELRQREEEAARKREEEIRAGHGTLRETWRLFMLPLADDWLNFVDWVIDAIKAVLLFLIRWREK